MTIRTGLDAHIFKKSHFEFTKKIAWGLTMGAARKSAGAPPHCLP